MAMTDGEPALLRAHAPMLFLDPLERFAPVAIEEFLAASATSEGRRRLADPPAEILGGGAFRRGLCIDPAAGEPKTAGRAHAMFARFAPTPGPERWRCYGEVLPPLDDGGQLLRYWYFYVDNPFGLRPRDLGRHVGDWESVLVELDAAGAIAAVTVFQHGSPQRIAVGEPPLRVVDGRPHAFVAEGSHAIYLAPGSQPRILKRDNTSEEGRHAVPTVLPLPGEDDAWSRWCGRWGPDNGPELSRPVLAAVRFVVRKSIGGDSPWGPLSPRRSRVERDPAAAARAGDRQPINRIGRVLHRIGERTWPRQVAIAAVEGGAGSADPSVRVRVVTRGSAITVATYVDALLVDAAGAAIGYARAPVAANRTAELVVHPLPGSGPPAEVRVAGYNLLDQRGEVLRKTLPAG